ncbi:MAG: hypothetical protein K8S27_04240 [Candidatus Omnitrophica bacterium]|nr:hypothetical protein [Candidatus Omnitrophota bacterium]
MKRFVEVHTGEIMAGGSDTVLRSNTNNACLVFIAYDSGKKIGGLAHSMFLQGELRRKWHAKDLYKAEKAIDELIEDMMMLGSTREDIEIYMVTGENVPHKEHDPDYDSNLSAAIELLKQKNVRLHEKPSVDVGRAHVALDVETGAISYI